MIITHFDGSRVSIAVIRLSLSVILSVCLSVRTIKLKRLKLNLPNLAPMNIKSKDKVWLGLRLGDRVSGLSYAPLSSVLLVWLNLAGCPTITRHTLGQILVVRTPGHPGIAVYG